MKTTLLATAAVAATGCSSGPVADYRVLATIDQGSTVTKFVTVEPGATKEDFQSIVDRSCGQSRSYCAIHFWDNAGLAATRFPMSGRQADAQVATFKRNKSTGYEHLEVF